MSSGWTTLAVIVLAGGVLVAAPALVFGQEATSPDWSPPRLASGEPDLQGVWDFRTMTPLQRPREFADRATLTAEEASEYEARTNAGRDTYDVSRNPSVHAKFWLDNGRSLQPDLRTSLIVDPPDGRIPPLTADARHRAEHRASLRRLSPRSHLDRSITERCMVGFNAGPPMNPGAYNNNVLILQTPGFVVLHNEMVHEVRVIAMDGRRPLPGHIRQILGVSRGHWEGDTLVVETSHFTDQTTFAGSGPEMRLTERFTRVSPDHVRYEYTIDDPASFERPWTATVDMAATEQPMFEFACHEGNYGLTNILVNARAADREDTRDTEER